MTDNVIRLEDAERAFRDRTNQSLGTDGLGAAGMELAAAILRDRQDLPTDLDVQVQELSRIRKAIASLRLYEERLNNAVLEHKPSKNFVAAGLSCEIRGGKDRKAWDSHGLLRELRKVAKRQNVNIATGERVMDDDEALMHVIESAARLEWRVTYLRGNDIEVDEFCETSPGKRTVVITDPDQ